MSVEPIKALVSADNSNLKKSKNVNFRSQTNNLERAPQEDTLEKQGMSTGAKVAIATAVVAGLFAAGDAIFNHGKNLKKIFGMADDAAKRSDEKADDVARDVEETIKPDAEKIKKKKAAIAKKNKARLQKRDEVKAKKNARKEAKAAMKAKAEAKAEAKAILAEAKKNDEIALRQKKARLASEGKLNFEVNVGDNRIIVKNGEIAECINAHNQKWMIDDKTAPEFVEQVQKAVDDKISLVIKEEKIIQQQLDRHAMEPRIAEAVRRNEAITKAITELPPKHSAEESAKVFALADEAKKVIEYCDEKYSSALAEASDFIGADIKKKFPKSKIVKHKDGTLSLIVKNGNGKVKYNADEDGIITTINYYDKKIEDGFVVYKGDFYHGSVKRNGDLIAEPMSSCERITSGGRYKSLDKGAKSDINIDYRIDLGSAESILDLSDRIIITNSTGGRAAFESKDSWALFDKYSKLN